MTTIHITTDNPTAVAIARELMKLKREMQEETRERWKNPEYRKQMRELLEKPAEEKNGSSSI